MGSPFASTRSNGTAKSSGPSLLACLICRQKHLKCDGKTPICGRCASAGIECQYTPSRRGYRGPSKKRRAEPIPEDGGFVDCVVESPSIELPSPEWNFPCFSARPTTVFSHGGLLDSGNNALCLSESGMHLAPGMTTPPTPESQSSSSSQYGDSYLIDLYYGHFHAAHPVLPPMRLLHRFQPPPYLEQAIKFIGSHFSSSVPSEVYRPTVISAVVDQQPSIEKVQTLLLLAIVLHSRNERAEAGMCLDRAMDLAYELGMHQPSFAENMGGHDPIREESLRRTWWELFVIEGMLTTVGVKKSFTASMIAPEVPLPCEERIYHDGLCPPPPSTVAQFDDRAFADDELSFSSFAYRIEAIRILGRVVLVGQMTQGHQEEIEAIDAKIASWFHHLPESKAELMRPDGTVDEMMFQAIMIINGASIHLHFPRSDLLSSPALAAELICGQSEQCLLPAFSHRTHAMKALKAASELSTLAAMRIPVTKHTPFFICALVLSAMVQLAAYSVKAGQIPDPRRDRLALTVGVFKSLGRTWAISNSVMRQIKAVARDVLDIGIRPVVDGNTFDIAAFLDGSQT